MLFLLAAALAVGVVVAVSGAGDEDPQLASPPAPEVAAQTAAFLAGTGAVLDRRHDASSAVTALSDQPDPRDCQAARGAVADAGAAGDALAAIERVPDAILRELLLGEMGTIAGALEACGPSSGELLHQRLAEARGFHRAVSDRRAVLTKGAGG